jgi:hypothetical protein
MQPLQRLIAEGGCRKWSTAIAHLVADPALVVTGIPGSATLPLSANVSASNSRSFDGQPLRFAWTLDGLELSATSSATIAIGHPGDQATKPGRYVLRLSAEDRRGHKAARDCRSRRRPTRLCQARRRW